MRDLALLLLLCVAGFFLGRYQTVERNNGRVDVFGRAIGTLVRPVALMGARGANGAGDFFHGVVYGGSLKRENERLRQIAAAAELYSQTLERLESEIEALRRAQGLPPPPGRLRIPAEVVGFYQHEGRITISAGLKQGVRPGLPVLSGGALFAVIQTADATTSQALLLSSPRQKLGAMVLRNPPSAGLLRGETATAYILEFVDPAAPVQVNDVVVTSGYSQNIPRGIPIGRVVQVDDNLEFGTRRAQVYPDVLIGSVREVVVLR